MPVKATRLICVDDDPVSLAQLKAELDRVTGKFALQLFVSPVEALRAHIEDPADIVISDLRMPEKDGIALISEMSAAHPDSLYLLLSGDADLEAALSAVNNISVFRFLMKPVKAEGLQLALDTAQTELNLRKLRRVSMISHAAVERLSAGIVFLNDGFQVIYKNESAERIFKSARIFEIGHDGILRAVQQPETAEFHRFLADVRKPDDAAEARSLFRFAAKGGEAPVVASVAYHARAGAQEAYYSIVLADSSRKRTTPESIAVSLNILPSEAKVVHAIAEGGTVEDAAEKSGVSVSSARTYLKNVFLKTGVSRQSELVRLVLLTAA